MIELFADIEWSLKTATPQDITEARRMTRAQLDERTESLVNVFTSDKIVENYDGVFSAEDLYDADGNLYTNVLFTVTGRFYKNGELHVHGTMFVVNVDKMIRVMRKFLAELNNEL